MVPTSLQPLWRLSDCRHVLVSLSQNEDIDIALDNCTGVAFAEMVNTYLKSKGQDEGKVAVIEVRLCAVNCCALGDLIKMLQAVPA